MRVSFVISRKKPEAKLAIEQIDEIVLYVIRKVIKLKPTNVKSHAQETKCFAIFASKPKFGAIFRFK